MTNIMWFSRHEMAEDQTKDLQRIFGKIKVSQVNKTIKSPAEIQLEIDNADVLAIVAPIALQQQFLKVAAGNKPVIIARSRREFTPDGKVNFIFDSWEQLIKIEVITKKL